MNDQTDLDGLLNEAGFLVDPYPAYARLREEAPVFWSQRQQQWLVSGLADCRTVLRDTTNFSSSGWERRYLEMLPPETQGVIPSITAHVSDPHLLISDGSLHDRLRACFREPFLPRSIEPLKPRISALVADLLDAIGDGDPVDVVSRIANPLPTNVIADMFGAPPADRSRFRGWSKALTEFFGQPAPDPADAVTVEALLTDFRRYLSGLIEERREAPTGDLATVLGDGRWDPEMGRARLGTAVLLIVAGHETTTNLIASSIRALMLHPEQLAGARSDSANVDRALEETLRWDSPIQRVRRVVKQDTDLRGVTLHKGDRVAVLVGSANRDPELCDRPERFDLARSPTAHMAFGSGAHFCLGNTLAKVEARIAVGAFLERFPHARLDDAWHPTWRPTLTQRSLVDLQMRVKPSTEHSPAVLR